MHGQQNIKFTYNLPIRFALNFTIISSDYINFVECNITIIMNGNI
jgi:hypothetical protein